MAALGVRSIAQWRNVPGRVPSVGSRPIADIRFSYTQHRSAMDRAPKAGWRGGQSSI